MTHRPYTPPAMRQIAEAFERSLYKSVTNQVETEPKTLTLDMLKEAMTKVQQVPRALPVHTSKYATALPSKKPHTDDMREMVERVGQVRVPASIKLKTMFGEMFIVHPDLIK